VTLLNLLVAAPRIDNAIESQAKSVSHQIFRRLIRIAITRFLASGINQASPLATIDNTYQLVPLFDAFQIRAVRGSRNTVVHAII